MKAALAAIAFAVLPASLPVHADDAAMWKLLKEGGVVALKRHTETSPGVGEQPGMRADDCATQPNLTAEGKRRAKAIGEALHAHGIEFDRVISSPLCRCLDTAKLAFGRVDETQALSRAGQEDQRLHTREMRATASEKRRGTTVMVSQGRIVEAVTGIMPAPGELVIVAPQGDGHFEVRGRLLAAP